MANNLIYIVDDEENIRELYEYLLRKDGFDVECFINGNDILSKMEIKMPNLIILDIMLDGMNGYDILKRIKSNQKFQNIPVILISARYDEMSKVKGLNLGADDYMTKPFGLLELSARINAKLRKANKNDSLIIFEDIIIDDNKHQVLVKDEEIELTLKEYQILKYLIVNKNKVISKDELLQKVWNDDYYYETRTIDIHISTLRKRISASNITINTIRGVGYIVNEKKVNDF